MADLRQYLASKGSPLAPYAGNFVSAGKKYGVDPKLLVAITGAESSFGKANTVNPFGWGPNIRFKNPAQAIDTVARGLASGYIKKGLRTIPAIGARWAPSGAANDPRGLNNNWTKNVTHYYNELGGVSSGGASSAGAMAPPGYTIPGMPPVPGRRPISVAPGLALQVPAQRIPGFNLNSNHWAQQLNNTMRSLGLPTTSFGNLSGAPQRVPGAKYQSSGFSIPGTPGIPGTPARAQTTAAGRTMPLFSDGMGSYPLARKGKIIGTPYAGTHNLGNWESDRAVDIAVPKGTPVRAMGNGTIGSQIGALNSSDPHMLGLRVHLKFGGNEAYYAHLSRLTVKAGQKVKKGQIIGYSGAANGVNHLHLGVKRGNPLSFV